MKYLLFTLFIFLSSCSQEDESLQNQEEIINLFTTVEYKQINGVDTDLLSLDIYYKSSIGEKKPVVIYVHGGG